MRYNSLPFRPSRQSSDTTLHIFWSLVLAGLLPLAVGCTSTHQVTRESDGYARVTEDLTGKTVQVTLHDGRTMALKNFYVGPDSTTGTQPRGVDRTFPTSSLYKAEVTERGIGLFQGAGLGIATPLATGGVISLFEEDEFIPASALVALLSVPGGLIGGIIGVIRGHRDVYRFTNAGPSGEGRLSRVEEKTQGHPSATN